MLSRGLFGVVTWAVFRQGVHGLLLCGGGSDLAEFLSTFCVLHTSVREREREEDRKYRVLHAPHQPSFVLVKQVSHVVSATISRVLWSRGKKTNVT